MTLASTLMSYEDHLVVPLHGAVRVGTLSAILVAGYLGRPRAEITRELVP